MVRFQCVTLSQARYCTELNSFARGTCCFCLLVGCRSLALGSLQQSLTVFHQGLIARSSAAPDKQGHGIWTNIKTCSLGDKTLGRSDLPAVILCVLTEVGHNAIHTATRHSWVAIAPVCRSTRQAKSCLPCRVHPAACPPQMTHGAASGAHEQICGIAIQRVVLGMHCVLRHQLATRHSQCIELTARSEVLKQAADSPAAARHVPVPPFAPDTVGCQRYRAC